MQTMGGFSVTLKQIQLALEGIRKAKSLFFPEEHGVPV